MSSNTHFFENFHLGGNSSEPIMANFAFMESPSSQLYPDFLKFASQEASPNSFLRGPTQTYASTHNNFKDQIGLYASSPFVSNGLLEPPMHQQEITQLPSVLENHKKTKGQRKRKKKNVESKGGVNIDWRGKATTRCRWSEYEDSLLMQLVEQHGESSWARVAENLHMRTGKQCRDRWHNCLRPNIINKPWCEEDDKLLVSLHKQFGNRWADIARSMPGRSENSIKNHWNATKRKQFMFTSPDQTNAEYQSYLLKDYITSVSSSASSNQINIQESFGFNSQNHESQMSLNARSSSFSDFGLGYRPEFVVNEIGLQEVPSHLVDQLKSDPRNDMDFIASFFDTRFR